MSFKKIITPVVGVTIVITFFALLIVYVVPFLKADGIRNDNKRIAMYERCIESPDCQLTMGDFNIYNRLLERRELRKEIP